MDPQPAVNFAIARSNWYEPRQQLDFAATNQAQDSIYPWTRRLAGSTATRFLGYEGQAGSVARFIGGEFLAPHMSGQIMKVYLGSKPFPGMARLMQVVD